MIQTPDTTIWAPITTPDTSIRLPRSAVTFDNSKPSDTPSHSLRPRKPRGAYRRQLTIIFGSVVPDSLRPVYELLRQWCGHRSVTFYERLTAAEAEVRRLEILIARLIHTVRERPFDIGGQ